MKSSKILLAALTALAFPLSTPAATISGLSVLNTSTADGISPNATDHYGEFATSTNLGSTGITTTNVANDTVSFTHQMQFYNGYFVGPTGPNFALTHQRNVSFDLAFTIEDPDNVGYTVNVESLLRGYSTADWDSGASVNSVVASDVTFSGRIDTDTSDATDTLGTQLNALTLGAGAGATANSTNTFVNNLGSNTDSYTSAAFIGTRDFALRFTTQGSGNTNVFLQNSQRGQGSVRFGLTNADTRLDSSGQPGGDAFAADDLGHLITVNAIFNETIPEPSRALLAFLAFTAITLRRRR